MAFLKQALTSFEVKKKHSKVTIPQERIAHTILQKHKKWYPNNRRLMLEGFALFQK